MTIVVLHVYTIQSLNCTNQLKNLHNMRSKV